MFLAPISTRPIGSPSVIPRTFAAAVFAGILSERGKAFAVGLPFNLFAARRVLAKRIGKSHVLMLALVRAATSTFCVLAGNYIKKPAAFDVCAVDLKSCLISLMRAPP